MIYDLYTQIKEENKKDGDRPPLPLNVRRAKISKTYQEKQKPLKAAGLLRMKNAQRKAEKSAKETSKQIQQAKDAAGPPVEAKPKYNPYTDPNYTQPQVRGPREPDGFLDKALKRIIKAKRAIKKIRAAFTEEEHKVLEIGTNELTKNYKKRTPGQK